MAATSSEEKVSYKDTLNLPQTEFPIRANAKQDDPELIKRWEKEGLYSKAFHAHKDGTPFIFHDGPPYANGNIHVGSAYNKILKDIATKSRRMAGHHVPVTPGWDCHGLPIEHKVTQEKPGLTPVELKKACRAYAVHWVAVQKEEFKRLGVIMDWDRPYLTMNYDYEAAILRAFGSFVDQGYIERKNKTVPWCPHCKTVLATAEIEYYDRKDPSIYVLFKLDQGAVDQQWPALVGQPVFLAIWTTTPWTLPLNRAVLIRPGTSYSIVRINGRLCMMASDLVQKIVSQLENATTEEVLRFNADALIALHARAQHPFIDMTVPIIASETVQLNEGTAFVHCAPGCGPEDYEIGVKHKLEIFSPISMAGTYEKGIQPAALEGMPVADGQGWAIKELMAKDALLYKTSIKHSFPHCWRCRNPLIFRATKQWFCDLSKHDLKEKAIAAVDTVQMLPSVGANRLKATLEGRLEWCLSRQRVWGVPIPAVMCRSCDYTYITSTLVEEVAKGVEKEGIEYWDRVQPAALVPEGFACPVCKGTDFKKEQDILDVWFDSGVSHYAVLLHNKELGFPADLYLEGKDQHRGWFQSSLLTALVLEGRAPSKTILTHGFTVDAQGKKMSKSLGNVVTPEQMIEQLGTDGLRLWAASIDYADDAVISPVLVENVKEVFRKIRNTCRFLLSNIYDYDHVTDAIEVDNLLPLDRHALYELARINTMLRDAYERYDFTAVAHILGEYSTTQLSAFYLDILKDRLYVETPDGIKRRSAQTVCWYILDTLTRTMAPILSFTAEQLSDFYQKDKKESIHLQTYADLSDVMKSFDASEEQVWTSLKELRSAVLKAIEGLREKGIVKHSLEAEVTLAWNAELRNGKTIGQFLADVAKKGAQRKEEFLKEFFIVSRVDLVAPSAQLAPSEYPGLFVNVAHARGTKCPRCWHWEESTHVHGLCKRCQSIVS